MIEKHPPLAPPGSWRLSLCPQTFSCDPGDPQGSSRPHPQLRQPLPGPRLAAPRGLARTAAGSQAASPGLGTQARGWGHKPGAGDTSPGLRTQARDPHNLPSSGALGRSRGSLPSSLRRRFRFLPRNDVGKVVAPSSRLCHTRPRLPSPEESLIISPCALQKTGKMPENVGSGRAGKGSGCCALRGGTKAPDPPSPPLCFTPFSPISLGWKLQLWPLVFSKTWHPQANSGGFCLFICLFD